MYRGYVCYCVVYWQLYWPDIKILPWFHNFDLGACLDVRNVGRRTYCLKNKTKGRRREKNSSFSSKAQSKFWCNGISNGSSVCLELFSMDVILLVALKYYESSLGARVLLVCIVSVPRRWIEWMIRIRWNLFGRRAGEAILPTPVVTTHTVFCSHFQHTTPPTCPKVVWSGSIFHAFSSW